MYVIEHAFLNLGKNKGRNILLGIIIFAIITSTVIALAIFNTTRVIIDETKMALQCAVRILPRMQTVGGRQQIVEGGTSVSSISYEQLLQFAESEYLDGSDVKPTGSTTSSISVKVGTDAVFYLKRPNMLEAFEAELRSKGLSSDYAVKTDESAFENVIKPVESLNRLSLTFLIIVLILGAVIMVLASVIAVRERKYEIGVLRAMGMKKKKIALGLWIEIITITCICFALGMTAGSVLSQPISDAMIVGQNGSAEPKSSSLADRLNAETGMTEKTTEVDISVSSITALEIFCVSVLLASIAGIISVSRITKYEPIKILMERN